MGIQIDDCLFVGSDPDCLSYALLTGHSNRMCLVVSYACGQCLQWDPWRGSKWFRCIFTAAWPVLN